MYVLIKYHPPFVANEPGPLEVDAVFGEFESVEEGIRYARKRGWTDWQVCIVNEV